MIKMASLQEQIDDLEKQKSILIDKIHELKCGQLLESYLEKCQNGYGILIPNFLVSEASKRGYVVLTDDIEITITATAFFYDKKGWDDFNNNSYQEFYISSLKFSNEFMNNSGEIAPILSFACYDDWYTSILSHNHTHKFYFIDSDDEPIKTILNEENLIHNTALYSISHDIGENFYRDKLNCDMDSLEQGDWDEPDRVKGHFIDKAVVIFKPST